MQPKIYVLVPIEETAVLNLNPERFLIHQRTRIIQYGFNPLSQTVVPSIP